MGFGGISIWSLLLILAIVVLLFGTKKLRNIGGDLGNAIRNFKKGMQDEEHPPIESGKQLKSDTEGSVIDAELSTKDNEQASGRRNPG